ncbi:MAG: protein kinase [Puniceicoccaceae bacterium]
MSCDDPSDKIPLLFEECIEIKDPEKREEYLNAACAGCAKVRAEIEKLLRAHEASGSFLMGGTPPGVAMAEANIDVPDFKPGECVGKYRLMGLIGEGSTSTVFLAEQEEPVRRWVALKIVKPGMDSRKVILRFGLERQALALMDHPGIAKLLDAGATSNGRPFFVMELVSGTSITRYCDEHELTLRERLELFIQICNAVFHAHQRGIIHRDLKPDNVLVSEVDGRTVLKIVDFGIAKVLHTWGASNATRTSLMPFIGTPAYMSPEQVQMDSTALDTRTDIYSLGALLYELLVGHPPFDPEFLIAAGLEEMCRIIRVVEPAAPSERFASLLPGEQEKIAEARGTTPGELRRRLIGDLDWITIKALEKPRGRRYGTASSFARDIKNYFEHLPVSAAKPSRRYRLAKLMKRQRKLVLTGSIAAALLFASTVMVTVMGIHARISEKQAIESELAAMEAEKHSHEAMVSMHVSSGMAAVDNNRPDQAVLWFANAALKAGAENRQADVNLRRAMCWMAETPIPIGAFKLEPSFAELRFSSDSRFLLALDGTGNWEIWDARIRDSLPWTKEVGPVIKAAWSPSGSNLAVITTDGLIALYEASSGNLLHSLEVDSFPVSLGFSTDSRYLVFGNSSLHVFDLQSASIVREIPKLQEAFVGFEFSSNSNQIVGVTTDGWVNIFSLGLEDPLEETGKPYPHTTAIRSESCSSRSNYQHEFLRTPRMSMPALADSDQRLLTRTGAYEVSLWDLGTGNRIQKVESACCSCKFITSPESGALACGLQGGKIGLWDIATGKPIQLLPSTGGCILDIAFGMGGKRLVTAGADGMAHVWAVEEGKEVQSPMHHCSDVDWVAFSNNGKMVASVQSDGLVRIWNVFDLKPDEHQPSGFAVPTMVHMDPAGSHFILTREPGWQASAEACISQASVFSTYTGLPIGSTLQYNGCVEAAAFSPDSGMLAVGMAPCESEDTGRLDFYDLAIGLKSVTGFALPSAPDSIAWSPTDGNVAVLCHFGELLMARPGPDMPVQWNAAFESDRRYQNQQVAFTPDGQTLVCLGRDGRILVRDARTGSVRYPPLLAGIEGFWSFTLSEDSRHMATSTVNGEVRIWDLLEGTPVGHELTHPSWVYRCRFSSDEQILVTAGHDGKVRLWNWREGRLVTEPMLHPREVYDAVFSPDDKWILTACRDGNIRIWDTDRGQLLAPPVKVGLQAFNVQVTPDGGRAVLGNLGNDVSILSLDLLTGELPYSTDDLCLIGEVVSSCTVESGSIRDLTSEEWLERYNRISRLHPEALQSGQAYRLENLSVEKASIFPTPLGSRPELQREGKYGAGLGLVP